MKNLAEAIEEVCRQSAIDSKAARESYLFDGSAIPGGFEWGDFTGDIPRANDVEIERVLNELIVKWAAEKGERAMSAAMEALAEGRAAGEARHLAEWWALGIIAARIEESLWI